MPREQLTTLHSLDVQAKFLLERLGRFGESFLKLLVEVGEILSGDIGKWVVEVLSDFLGFLLDGGLERGGEVFEYVSLFSPNLLHIFLLTPPNLPNLLYNLLQLHLLFPKLLHLRHNTPKQLSLLLLQHLQHLPLQLTENLINFPMTYPNRYLPVG